MVGVALGGSWATGRADAGSDLDLYVLTAREPDPAARDAAAAEAGAEVLETGNRWFGLEDAWRLAGTSVDVMYWDEGWIADRIAAAMEQHEPQAGYSTALVHTMAMARLLADSHGRFTALQDRARAPYPDALARAVVAHNLPLLGGAVSSFADQIEDTAARGDAVAVHHRTTAFLASFFDVAFAANRRLHPGEKRLMDEARALPDPPDGLENVPSLLTAPDPDKPALARTLATSTQDLASRAGLL